MSDSYFIYVKVLLLISSGRNLVKLLLWFSLQHYLRAILSFQVTLEQYSLFFLLNLLFFLKQLSKIPTGYQNGLLIIMLGYDHKGNIVILKCSSSSLQFFSQVFWILKRNLSIRFSIGHGKLLFQLLALSFRMIKQKTTLFDLYHSLLFIKGALEDL